MFGFGKKKQSNNPHSIAAEQDGSYMNSKDLETRIGLGLGRILKIGIVVVAAIAA
jgi:hypothetical protein